MNEQKAKELTERYFEGNTTLGEEQQLYAYFTSESISSELMPLRQMFLDMCQLQGCEPAPKAAVASLKHRPRWPRIAIAAGILAMAGIVTTLQFIRNDHSDYEMIAYGERQNNREAVMREVGRTLGEAQNTTSDIDAELKDAFGQQ